MSDSLQKRQLHIPRILLGAASSGSGKTTVTVALLAALRARGIAASPFKCGPDYIDPMFHERVFGAPSRNLDPFMMDEKTLRRLFVQSAAASDVAVIEGVMGYYDGLRIASSECSTWDVARITETPSILLVNAAGMSFSSLAIAAGFQRFKEKSLLKGVLFNRMSEKVYRELKAICEQETDLMPLGYFPPMKDISLKSRHLGLITADEVEDLQKLVALLGERALELADIDGILAIAGAAPVLDLPQQNVPVPKCRIDPAEDGIKASFQHAAGFRTGQQDDAVRIAVARDKAFCFYYADGLVELERAGASIVTFSPLDGVGLPENVHGVYLGGGYPELYCPQLSANEKLKEDLRDAHFRGMPIFAECGGYMYLTQSVTDEDGKNWPMAGLLKGACVNTKSLRRFGYIELTAVLDSILCNKGDSIRAHEFHYFDCDMDSGSGAAQEDAAFIASKGDMSYPAFHSKGSLLAGWPHIHFSANPAFAQSFVKSAIGFKGKTASQ